MRMTRVGLLLLFFLFPFLLPAQTDNTVYVKNFPGVTVGQMATAAQALCNPTLTCIVVFDPSLARVPQGTLPKPCATCVWEDYRIPGSLSITGNVYVNGSLIGGNTGEGGTLAAPTLSPSGGAYSGAQSVTIGLPSGATGCYTLDGSTPMGTSGTCSYGYTYGSPIAVTTSAIITVIATEPNWTNSPVTTDVYTINSSAYSDNFSGPNGSLGSNWAEPTGANGALQNINHEIYAATPGPGVVHSGEVYTGASFSSNQWSLITVESGIGSNTPGNADQFALVRGSTAAGGNFYNDAVAVGNNLGGLGAYRIGNNASVDFCAVGQALTNYSIGDTHELDVAGSGPVFFWSKHNGAVDATCYTNLYVYSAGSPGLGVEDQASTPVVALGPWQGGSLPNFSATPSDNFQRANSKWLGVNWWMDLLQTAQGFFALNNNSVAFSSSAGNANGVAIWTTAFGLNQSSQITIGNLASGDWLGAVTRCSLPPEPMVSGKEKFYLALDDNGAIDLFAYNQGIWESLSNLGTYSGAVSTIELDATGSAPVSLTVKINGTQFGNTYSDSTYELGGTYAGFAAYGSASSTVTGWAGANL
ncbi:MAG: chitobiase/beta-hexosaminidase C-terminal domain-containing protein [Terracidiphilus sp.]